MGGLLRFLFLCALAIVAGCATDIGGFGPDSGTNNDAAVVQMDTNAAPVCTPACRTGFTCTRDGCVPNCNPVCRPGATCRFDGTTWGCEEVWVDDSGVAPPTDTGVTPPVDSGPTCPACALNQRCQDGVCVSNCATACVGREMCVLLASAGWTCIDLNPPPPDAGPTFACALNETRGCVCAGGVPSAQTCLNDRSGFGPCQCVIDAGMPTPDVSVVIDVPILVDAPFSCLPGTANCDGNQSNSCETDTRNEVMNCGSCGNVCPARANGAAVCLGGRCDLVCTTGFQNCNGTASDGCETDTRTNLTSCGTCGTVCPARNNATATCTAGACGFTCLPGYADCDNNPVNGCEVDTRVTEGACGRCGNVCGAGQVCSNGSCQFTCSQADGGVSLVSCPGGATCISLANNLANCGRCGNVCGANIHAHATCVSGVCGNACNTGFGDCDNVVANGCERELSSDPLHCGTCGNVCPARANATTSCSSSSCRFTCNTGFGDCNFFAGDGCETDTQTNTLNCGACGRSCPSGQSCSAGVCVGPINPICPAGQANCGSSLRPICINLASDHSNCGACGWWCYSDEICNSGNCLRCPSGQRACGNTCTDILSNNANCGACGRICPSGTTCTAGACTTPCPTGQTLCGGACVNVQTDTNNCATCGNVCPTRANAVAACNGSCRYVCNASFGDCNTNPVDGCEVNLFASDVNNCGACGRSCASGQSCSAGICVTPGVDGGVVTDAGTPADVVMAPVVCPQGMTPRTITYRIPTTVPSLCGGTARPVLWGGFVGETIGVATGVTVQPVGTFGTVPLYHAPVTTGTPSALQFTDTTAWGEGNFLEMSARCGNPEGTYYEAFNFWGAYANLAAAGGSFVVNGVERASDVVRVGNKLRFVLGPSCVPAP